MSEADRQYLGGHDVPMTVERMTCMLISDKPADPVAAMIQWLGAQKATPPPRPLRLHQFAVSVNCLQVALFLKDSGLPVEIVNLDPTASPPPHKAAAYVAKFPRGQVPALEDGDVYLEESTAMLRYVCNRYRLGAPWYPVDPVARYQVDRVLDWRQSTFYPALGKLCYPRFGFAPAEAPEAAAATEETVKKELGFFLAHLLKPNAFCAGDRPSIADYTVAVACVFLKAVPGFTYPPGCQEYLARFAAASPHYAEVMRTLNELIASKASPPAPKP